MRIFLCAITLLVITASLAKGQGNERCRWVNVTKEPFTLDTLSVLEESIRFNTADSITFLYDINHGTILIESFPEGVDSLQICYTILPFALHTSFFHRDLSIYDSSAFFEDNRDLYNVGLIGGREELFPTEGLSKSGSISRGISFGNTQDVFVNSALNLQLDGKITENINVRAAINDQNIPFQPEGNTQQLQEFDKVFIQFYNEHTSLTAGDIVLKNKASEFLRYYKNVQGGQFTSQYKVFKNSTAETSASISVAKGKFTSEQIDVKEGVLGPYKLRGPQNEAFIIVLANSERVYLDGELLKRGFSYDYIIDYNQGEITFTNQVLITAFSRVRIDYEYSDRNYSRTIVSGSHYQDIGKFNVFANYYSEKDNRNRPLTFELSDQDKIKISQIGDDLRKAVISGVDSVPYNVNQILYKRTDSLGFDPVYVFSTNPDSAIYDISFSDVGQGNGNYRLTQAHVNGRIYEWVAPSNGIPQGKYEPVIAVPTPSKKQMFTAGAGFKLTGYESVFSELAVSENDVNLFSEVNSADDQGKAYKGGLKSAGRAVSFLTGYKWHAGFDYEYNEKNFRPIDRYRYIEYDRNWNFVPSDSAVLYDDNIFNATIGMADSKRNSLDYRLSFRKRGEAVEGFQHAADLNQNLGRFQVTADMFLLQASHEKRESDWKKLDAALMYNSKYFVPGYQYSVEQNEITAKGTDSLIAFATGLPLPLNYNAHTFFIKSNDTLNTRFNLNYTLREDFQARNGRLVDAASSETTHFSAATNIKGNHDLSLSVTYRTLENYTLENQDDQEETIMGRIDWFADLLDNHIRSELTYSVANAQEPRREFIFLKVPTGEGTHTWRDEDGDGIQDLNEFYEAINPDERNFAKIFVPTNEFLLAYSSSFNYRLNFSMPRNWRSKSGLQAFLAKFSNVTAWNIDKKHTDEEASARFLPFANAIEDEDLLSIRESFRSTMFYDRSNPQFGMDGGLMISERKELLTNGFDTRRSNEFQLNSRINIKRSYNFRIGGIKGWLYNASDFLSGRNYEIAYYELKPEVEWLPANNFRLTGTYSYTDKENTMAAGDSPENAKIHALGIEGKFTQVSKRTLNLQFKYINIDFRGEENTPIGYELLEALRPGRNFTWTFNLQQRIAEGLQISVNYEGRKSTDRDVIHIGRMQVSALF